MTREQILKTLSDYEKIQETPQTNRNKLILAEEYILEYCLSLDVQSLRTTEIKRLVINDVDEQHKAYFMRIPFESYITILDRYFRKTKSCSDPKFEIGVIK